MAKRKKGIIITSTCALLAGAAVIAELANEYAAKPDQPAFFEMLNDALQQLHEGSIARYRLRRSEFIAWQQAQDRS
mgnify:CR=1 FL=1